MDTMNKSLVAMYSFFALVASSALLEACSNTEIEQAVKPMEQPFIAVPIKTSSFKYSGLEPQNVTDVNGNTTAVWEEYDGARFNIWTMRRVAGESWGIASLLETDNAGDAYSPQVAVDGIGNVTAVWKQFDGKRFNIYANRYLNSTGWEGVKQVDDGVASIGNASAPLVTYDAAGYAMVVWQETDGLNTKTWVNRRAADAGWSSAKQLTTNALSTDYPHFAFDAAGLITVVTEKSDRVIALPATRNANNKNGYKQVSIYSKRYQ